MSSTDLGTIDRTKTGFSWTGAWVVVLVLTVLFAVSLIATSGSGRVVDRAPAAPAFGLGYAAAGGPSTVRGDAQPKGTASQPIVINGSVCHQCR